jgi:cytoskeleton protein RodZ
VTTVLSPALAQAAAGGSAAPVAATAGAATPASAAAVPAADIVVFRANGPSWVEVTDAKGVVAVRKLLAAGEATGASGVLPLQVTIGRADFTQVHVRGKAFDLGPVSRDNVARFEVQ